MKFNILTLFPQMINDYLNYSIIKRACEHNLIFVNTINPRDFTVPVQYTSQNTYKYVYTPARYSK